MHVPILASHFCQVAWVVKDIAKAETFFTQIMGVKKFVRVDSLAQDNANKTFRRDLDNRLDALLTEHQLFKRDMDGYLPVGG